MAIVNIIYYKFNVKQLRRLQMKIAVLFICHIVNNESMSRFNMLKTACDKLGFNIYWAIDCAADQTTALPFGIDFYSFLYERYEAEMPFAVYRQSRS